MPHTLRSIQELVGGELIGDGSVTIAGVNELEQARLGELAFAEDARRAGQVQQTQASAVIVTAQFPPVAGKNLLRVANPREAFVQVMRLFDRRPSVAAGIHASAVISPEAVLAPTVTVGEYVVIRAGARIGPGTVIDSGVHVGAQVVMGAACVIGPNVVLRDGTRLGDRVVIHGGSVIGDDGFGYVWGDRRHVKIPQLGNVIIEDDVEIGCNVCVDRATLGSTVIRRGTKVDNLVQIAHNNVIGEDVIITGQVGLSGSVTVGNRAMLGGRSGVVDHVRIGEDARLGAAAVVTKNVKAGETVWGYPAREGHQVKRELASLTRLPRLIKQFLMLLKRVDRTESRLDDLERRRPTPDIPDA